MAMGMSLLLPILPTLSKSKGRQVNTKECGGFTPHLFSSKKIPRQSESKIILEKPVFFIDFSIGLEFFNCHNSLSLSACQSYLSLLSVIEFSD